MKQKAKPEIWMVERCYITELINDEAWPEFSIARTRVEPGVTTQLHALSVHEVYVIESGTGLMTVGDDDPFPVGPGEIVTIPKHVAQSIENTGKSDLLFLCVCAPNFSQECYNSLE
jgi:mannose-6-phosphate isomerase-like protein (cupin superfamily)